MSSKDNSLEIIQKIALLNSQAEAEYVKQQQLLSNINSTYQTRYNELLNQKILLIQSVLFEYNKKIENFKKEITQLQSKLLNFSPNSQSTFDISRTQSSNVIKTPNSILSVNSKANSISNSLSNPQILNNINLNLNPLSNLIANINTNQNLLSLNLQQSKSMKKFLRMKKIRLSHKSIQQKLPNNNHQIIILLVLFQISTYQNILELLMVITTQIK